MMVTNSSVAKAFQGGRLAHWYPEHQIDEENEAILRKNGRK